MKTLITELGHLRAYLFQIMHEAGVTALAPRLVQRHGEGIVDELDDLYDRLANAEFDEVEPDPEIVDRLRILVPKVDAMLGDDDGRRIKAAVSALERGNLSAAIGSIVGVIGAMHGELDPHGSAEELDWMLSKASEEEAQRRRAKFRVV